MLSVCSLLWMRPIAHAAFTGADKALVDFAEQRIKDHPKAYHHVCVNGFRQRVIRSTRRAVRKPGGRHPDRKASPAHDKPLGSFGGKVSGEAIAHVQRLFASHNSELAAAPLREAMKKNNPPTPPIKRPGDIREPIVPRQPEKPPIIAPPPSQRQASNKRDVYTPTVKEAKVKPAAVLNRRPLFSDAEFKQLRTREDVESLAFTADSKYAVAWTEQTVVVWDWGRRRAVFETKRKSGSHGFTALKARLVALQPASVSPVAVGLRNYQTHHMTTGRKLSKPEVTGQTQAHGAPRAWSPDGRWLAKGYFTTNSGKASPLHIFDTRTGKARHTFTPILADSAMPLTYPHDKRRIDSVWASAFSSDSRYFAAASMGGKVTVWDVARGREHAVFDVGECLPDRGKITWLGDDAIIVPARNAAGFSRCDMKSKKVLPLVKGKPDARVMPRGQHNLVMWDVSPDASRLIIRVSIPGLPSEHNLPLMVFDLNTGAEIGWVKSNRATRVAISPDGKHVAVGTLYSHVLVYRMEDFETIARSKSPLPLVE